MADASSPPSPRRAAGEARGRAEKGKGGRGKRILTFDCLISVSLALSFRPQTQHLISAVFNKKYSSAHLDPGAATLMAMYFFRKLVP